MKLMEITKKPGTFAGIRFDQQTNKAIHSYNKTNNIQNPIHPRDMHITLLYSKKHLPNYTPAGKISELAEPFKFTIFKSNPDDGSDPKNCLVLLVKSKFLHDRFDFLMDEHKASYDFDEYTPHITFSYDAGNVDVKQLPKFENDIQLTSEYTEELTDD